MHPIILRCLCQAMFFKAVKEDTVIFREGDVGDNFYYIVHGVVSLWQHKAEEEQTADEIRAERWDSLAAKLLEEDKVTKFVVAEAHKKIDTQQLSHIDQLLQKVALDMGVKSAKLLKEMHGLYDDVTDAQSLEFMKFDVDGTGSLSKEEFRNFYADWCHRHGKQVHIEQLDRLFDALDTDHSGSLSTNEVESQRLAHAAPATPLLPPNVHREHASSLHAPRAIDTVSHAPGSSAGEQTRPLAAEQRTELKELELQMQSLRGLGGAKGRPKHRRKHKPMNPHGLLNKERQRLLGTLQAGYSFGELALLADTPRSASAKTVTESSFLCISRDVFTKLLKGFFAANQGEAVRAVSAVRARRGGARGL